MRTRIKICGITRPDDALTAARLGADAIGLVFYAKSPRHVSMTQAVEIAAHLLPFVTSVGLFVNPSGQEVNAVLQGLRLDLLQFHGEEPPEFCRQFGVPYIKAARVKPGSDLVQYAARFHDARALLLDAYVEGAHGGTGQAFDWGLIPAGLPLPVILSGGLTPANVEDGVRQVRPWAVDVSSGVEATEGNNALKGIKDAARMAAFMQGVRNAEV
jgi:phosphoribosylanthranilate isomerase